jgi:DNA ligase-1
VLLADVALASRAVAATTKRSEKTAAVAECLRRADPAEVPVVVAYLSGELRQRRTGVGWASLRDVPGPAEQPSLGVAEVDTALEMVAALAGAGSQAERARQVAALFARATEVEQHLLRGLLSGGLRQGALEGVMLDAVALAAGLPPADVRRAAMLRGALGPVAEAALVDGAAGLAGFRLQVGRPVKPMLASPGDDVASALARLGTAALEWKLDGVRAQVHRDGADVAVFTRSLDDVTSRVPEVVEAALDLPVRSVVLDAEAIALRPDGRPRPFQETGSRIGSRVDVAAARETAPCRRTRSTSCTSTARTCWDSRAVSGSRCWQGRSLSRSGSLAWSPPTPPWRRGSSPTPWHAGTKGSWPSRWTWRTRRAAAGPAG